MPVQRHDRVFVSDIWNQKITNIWNAFFSAALAALHLALCFVGRHPSYRSPSISTHIVKTFLCSMPVSWSSEYFELGRCSCSAMIGFLFPISGTPKSQIFGTPSSVQPWRRCNWPSVLSAHTPRTAHCQYPRTL